MNEENKRVMIQRTHSSYTNNNGKEHYESGQMNYDNTKGLHVVYQNNNEKNEKFFDINDVKQLLSNMDGKNKNSLQKNLNLLKRTLTPHPSKSKNKSKSKSKSKNTNGEQQNRKTTIKSYTRKFKNTNKKNRQNKTKKIK